jgi:hypothetical protein
LKRPGTGSTSLGIGSCRFVGIWGLASSGLGADLGPNSALAAGFLQVSRALLAQPRLGPFCGQVLHGCFLEGISEGPRKTHNRRFTGGSRPQGHLPRLISDGFGPFLFDDPGSGENLFMCHSFMCFFGALISEGPTATVSGRCRRFRRPWPKVKKYLLQCSQTCFEVCLEGGEGGPDIVDFDPLAGPTRPRGGLGKGPAWAPLELHRFSAR